MFHKILVANRGEIACRIIAAAYDLGIEAVAVVSEADRDSRAARMADEVRVIGPAPAADSYLNIAAIVAAAKDTGADAVHPGYGFLSENADFARAVGDAGLTFIGPPADAIATMGDKLRAKKLAGDAGVAVLPGHAGALDDPDAARAAADTIGYPVILKAAAGGGGRGMRVVRDPAEFVEALRATRAEAKGAFGDDRVFLEKFLDNPRHIEIQVLADTHGDVVHLGERECSLQRRHQKLIEEAPSPVLDAATRDAMTRQSCDLARAVGYTSAGTVEFVFSDGEFFFLEMNTRLQVEHPVTEMTTGLDLVQLMIRIAAGEPLPFTQADVETTGWAVEARLYAEDPARGFLPSPGRLTRFRPPVLEPGELRLDTGVDEGAVVTPYYDPMLAKLIAHGPDRATALDRLATALDSFEVAGLRHNVDLLAALTRHPRYQAGDCGVDFIAREYPDGFTAPPPAGDDRAVTRAIAAVVADLRDQRAGAPWVIDRETLTVTRNADTTYQVTGDIRIATQWRPGQSLFVAVVTNGGAMHDIAARIAVDHDAGAVTVTTRGTALTVIPLRPHIAALAARMPDKSARAAGGFLTAPIPGLLRAVHVTPGDTVRPGDDLAVVEAMKMENILRADHPGTVAKILAAIGDNLAAGQQIIEFAE